MTFGNILAIAASLAGLYGIYAFIRTKRGKDTWPFTAKINL